MDFLELFGAGKMAWDAIKHFGRDDEIAKARKTRQEAQVRLGTAEMGLRKAKDDARHYTREVTVTRKLLSSARSETARLTGELTKFEAELTKVETMRTDLEVEIPEARAELEVAQRVEAELTKK